VVLLPFALTLTDVGDIVPSTRLMGAFAFLVLGEHVEIRDLLGIVPVALGIYLVTRPAAAR
jgi:drug/metabolite transporter (DMT)-like permease